LSNVPDVWVIEWLSEERYGKYLRAAGGDHGRATALYEWNSRLAAELLHDLGHVEVCLRNAYDRALLGHPSVRGGDWIEGAAVGRLFPVHPSGRSSDKNAAPRRALALAHRHAGVGSDGRVPRGKIVAELPFGFWSYLTDALHEKTLWVPALHNAYLPAADRPRLHRALAGLRAVRNRLAHHESVFDQRPEDLRRTMTFVARQLSPDVRNHVERNSRVADLIAARP
jgi:hypothetical protein